MAVVSAKIRVEVEIEVGRWEAGCTFEALRDQVASEGARIARGIFEARELAERPRGRVVGDPKVICVIVADDDKGGA